MEKKIYKQRMYAFTLRHLSPLDKGIQAAHAIVEYGRMFNDNKEYKQWADEDKTLIVLNGGTTTDLKELVKTLVYKKHIHIGQFFEPDLDNIRTAVVCLIDERVWNTEGYPNINNLNTINESSLLVGNPKFDIPDDFYDKFGGKNKYDRCMDLRNFIFSYKLA